GEALEAVRGLLATSPADPQARALLERILVLDGAEAAVRFGALDLLRKSYDGSGMAGDVIRVLGVALGFADPQAAIDLHREIAGRLVSAGRPLEAMEHH